MTKNIKVIMTALVISTSLLLLNSCVKDDFVANHDLVDADLKEMKLSTGVTDHEVPIKAEDWTISFVKNALTGEVLKDTAGEPVKLEEAGVVKLENGWLTLEKTADKKLKVTLLENFSDSPRNFIIGLLSENKQDEVQYIQSRAKGYELVDKKIEEIKENRKQYTSTEGCTTITLSNTTDKDMQVDLLPVFKDVKSSSEFISDDYGAFSWMSTKDSLQLMEDLIIDGMSYWSRTVPYVQGTTYAPYLTDGNKHELTLRPHTTVVASGEMDYVERECKYTFTVKNIESGHLFKINGTWKQKVPITSHTITN